MPTLNLPAVNGVPTEPIDLRILTLPFFRGVNVPFAGTTGLTTALLDAYRNRNQESSERRPGLADLMVRRLSGVGKRVLDESGLLNPTETLQTTEIPSRLFPGEKAQSISAPEVLRGGPYDAPSIPSGDLGEGFVTHWDPATGAYTSAPAGATAISGPAGSATAAEVAPTTEGLMANYLADYYGGAAGAGAGATTATEAASGLVSPGLAGGLGAGIGYGVGQGMQALGVDPETSNAAGSTAGFLSSMYLAGAAATPAMTFAAPLIPIAMGVTSHFANQKERSQEITAHQNLLNWLGGTRGTPNDTYAALVSSAQDYMNQAMASGSPGDGLWSSPFNTAENLSRIMGIPMSPGQAVPGLNMALSEMQEIGDIATRWSDWASGQRPYIPWTGQYAAALPPQPMRLQREAGDGGGGGEGGDGGEGGGGGGGGEGGMARGGVSVATHGPKKVVFGEAGPETAIFIPRRMRRPGIQGRERDVVAALHRALDELSAGTKPRR